MVLLVVVIVAAVAVVVLLVMYNIHDAGGRNTTNNKHNPEVPRPEKSKTDAYRVQLTPGLARLLHTVYC